MFNTTLAPMLLSNLAAGSQDIIAGTTWQMGQWAFIHFQLGVSRHNVIYGTLALLPVFMMWIYTSWIIVLAGMQIVWYLQSELPRLQGGASKTLKSQPIIRIDCPEQATTSKRLEPAFGRKTFHPRSQNGVFKFQRFHKTPAMPQPGIDTDEDCSHQMHDQQGLPRD